MHDDASATSATDSKASPFGAARPVDTATKEREVQEKLELALRQRKEADEKAKEDKAARDASARAQRAERADRGQAQDDETVSSPTTEKGRRTSRQQNGTKAAAAPKENGEGSAQAAKPGFSILSREAEGGEDAEQPGSEEKAAGQSAANGDAVTPAAAEDASNPIDTTTAETEPTARQLEDDGWSTVPSKQKNSRRGGQRAIAS